MMNTKIVIGFSLFLSLNFSESLIIQNPAELGVSDFIKNAGLFSDVNDFEGNSGTRFNLENNDLEPRKEDVDNWSFLPKNFDARKKWPRCRSIGAVRYQSNCNSDWAIAAAGAFSDRMCINSKGKTAVNISVEHILTCAVIDGCIGGEPNNAWDFLSYNGAVTGGEYRSYEGCQPYEIAPCGSYGYPKCNKTRADTPLCYRYCRNSYYSRRYESDLYRTRGRYKTISPKNENAIMEEVYYNGSVAVVFDGYKDLFDHVSGVYVRKSNEFVSRHSVKIIGWGIAGTQPYWLMVNSWGVRWAEQGLFKMDRDTLSASFAIITAGYA